MDEYESTPSTNKEINSDDITSNDKLNKNQSEENITGIVKLKLSDLTQKIIGCEVNKNVTTENPWIFIKKQLIEDNIDSFNEQSDFKSIENYIINYPDNEILIGYASIKPFNDNNNYEYFYICLTVESRDIMINQIKSLKCDQENYVKNIVSKSAKSWKDLGSEVQLDKSIKQESRPLLEIKVELRKSYFDLRKKLMDQDGNEMKKDENDVDGGCVIESFNDVTRRLVSRGDQCNCTTSDNQTQTTISTPINSWSQYESIHKPINISSDNHVESFKTFITNNIEIVSDHLMENNIWNLYSIDLSLDEANKMNEYENRKLSQEKLYKSKNIEVGRDHSRGENLISQYRDIARAYNKVLVWSFNDCHSPKLILKCYHEVTAISIRPLDEHIIVGGCSNGQIVIWSISDHLEKLYGPMGKENKGKFLITMKIHLKDYYNCIEIYPVAMSSLKNNSKSKIMQIIWLGKEWKINENGQIVKLQTNCNAKDLGWQFLTSSEDSTMAFWDLSLEDYVEQMDEKDQKENDEILSKSKLLSQSISPFKILDGIINPIHTLSVKLENENDKIIITAMALNIYKISNKKNKSLSTDKNDKTHQHYKDETLKTILVGTLNGDVGKVMWNGFEFTAGLKMNREMVQWIWLNKEIHDGPVTHVLKSPFCQDVILTIGGQTFAIWREDFNTPVFCKKSSMRYIGGCWSTSRPSVIILARVDDIVEIWNILIKNSIPCYIEDLTSRIIIGIHNHEINSSPECIAYCDFNNNIKIFTEPIDFSIIDNENDTNIMKGFIKNHIDKIQQMKCWQKHSVNSAQIKNKGEKKTDETIEAEKKYLRKIKEEFENRDEEKEKQVKRQLINDREKLWRLMELKRMKEAILKRKGLTIESLEKMKELVEKMQLEEKKKKEKMYNAIHQKDRIFEETVTSLFPERKLK